MKNNSILFLTQAAMIAALYVVLTILFAPFSFGEIQVRIAESLTILPFFTPAAIPGLFAGCIIANLVGGAILPDIVFGSLATLLGAFFTYTLRRKNRFFAPIPPILANALIVPLILRYAYGINLPIYYLIVSVGIGEVVSCGILGMILFTPLYKYRHKLFPPISRS